jgi:uncharacterized membrane protein YtjA (UPF0391 family)
LVPEDNRRNASGNGELIMLGWMMVFGIMAIMAAILTVAAGPVAGLVSTKIATYVFGLLFVVCLLTSVARGRV